MCCPTWYSKTNCITANLMQCLQLGCQNKQTQEFAGVFCTFGDILALIWTNSMFVVFVIVMLYQYKSKLKCRYSDPNVFVIFKHQSSFKNGMNTWISRRNYCSFLVHWAYSMRYWFASIFSLSKKKKTGLIFGSLYCVCHFFVDIKKVSWLHVPSCPPLIQRRIN